MRFIFFFYFVVMLLSCSSEDTHPDTESAEISKDSLRIKDTSGQSREIFGYRCWITGDFDGNGSTDTLTEHYVSQLDGQETNKFYSGLEYGDMVSVTAKKEPLCYVLSSNGRLDTLFITDQPWQFGLSYLKNEGDLNGDGSDEVSYVINHADWSNMNSWHIITYAGGGWQPLYQFSIWDWQIPDLPETRNRYGLFGLVSKEMVHDKEREKGIIQEEYNNFEGLVKPFGKHKIQIIYSNDEAMLDTMMVDLSKLTE